MTGLPETGEGRGERLRCAPLPAGTWEQNLRRALSPQAWKRLSAQARAGGGCWYCGAQDRPLEAHEAWRLDPPNARSYLTDIRAACSDCHAVIHAGRSVATGQTDAALQTLTRVNGWTLRQSRSHLREALEQHAAYREGTWNVRMDSGAQLHAVFASPAGPFTTPLTGETLTLMAHAQRQLGGMPGAVEFLFRDVPLRALIRTERYAAADVQASHLTGHAPQAAPAAVSADLIAGRGGLRGYLHSGAPLGPLPCTLHFEPST